MEKMPRDPMSPEDFAEAIDNAIGRCADHHSANKLQGELAAINGAALHTILLKLKKIEEHLAGPGIHVDPERRKTRRRIFLDSHLHKPDHRQLPDRRE